jgi:CheY-like chemotaxis protein
MMGGSITVESEYGKGTCFTVRIIQQSLPEQGVLGDETASVLRNMQYTVNQNESIIYSQTPYTKVIHSRVLAVDDVPANLKVIEKMLAPYDLHIDIALSGREAIEKIQNSEYDLILLDHMMPEMDGTETLKQIREWEKNPGQTPVVAFTADAMHGMKEYYIEQGFNDYLPKPIDTKELDEILRKWLKTKEKSEEPDSLMTEPKGRVHTSLLIRQAIEAQRLDALNHLRAAFDRAAENGTGEYNFEKFIAIIETWTSHKTESLRECALALTEAGRQKDIQSIRGQLGNFYDMVKDQLTSAEIPKDILQHWEEQP